MIFRKSLLLIYIIFIAACVSTPDNYDQVDIKPFCATYKAFYSLSLHNVERPKKVSQRYGAQKIDTLGDKTKYKFYFEDELVKILWNVTPLDIAFELQNKTNHSIKIVWDEAAYVDRNRRSLRVMHSGVKYANKEQSMIPSIVVRNGIFTDIVFPTDYIFWQEGSRFTAGSWGRKQLISPNFYINCTFHQKSDYPTFKTFDEAAKSKLGKTVQVLLPLQIKDVTNDYIFTFKVENVSTEQESRFGE